MDQLCHTITISHDLMNIFKKLIMALIFFTDIVQFKHTFFIPSLSLSP